MVKNASVWNKIKEPEKIQKLLPQTPKTRKDILRDAGRKAFPPGKRISKSGKPYWETRENRSDVTKTLIRGKEYKNL